MSNIKLSNAKEIGMQPSVSVVITNFNYGRFLAHAVNSALEQREANVEVVVVDDGSTDDSRQVIASFAGRVTPVLMSNGGQGAAFNAGWRAATGEVIMFLDADDMLLPRIAATVARLFAARPELSRIQFPLEVLDEAGRWTGACIPAPHRQLFSGDAVPALVSCPDDIVWQPTSGNAFSRQCLDEILPMPEQQYRICADYYLSNLAPLHGPVVALSEAGGGYRVHGLNRHFSPVEHIDKIRENVWRTHHTHAALIEECRRLGIVGLPARPEMVRSVTATANRLLSYRLDRRRHPLPQDRRSGLLRLGLRSARARRDVSLTRRVAFGLWFVVAAIAPRRALPLVARPFVVIDTDQPASHPVTSTTRWAPDCE